MQTQNNPYPISTDLHRVQLYVTSKLTVFAQLVSMNLLCTYCQKVIGKIHKLKYRSGPKVADKCHAVFRCL